jgi:glycosyltransferase involved in cell wall biosynthesis
MKKKEILIFVYDMEIGGIERSLINMLESFDYEKYNVDLLICNHTGDFLSLIPKKVNILPQVDEYTVFRKSAMRCIKEGHFAVSIIRIVCKFIASIKAKYNKLKEGSGYIQMQLVAKYTSFFIPKPVKKYDLAISYAWPHDIVALKIEAHKKMAWIHTDYSELEIDNKMDFAVWNKFDYIASISEACTRSFLIKYPSLKDKMILIENITSPGFIKKMADDHPSCKGKNGNQAFHILSVGRLSYAKGFDLAIQALRKLHDKGLTNIRWFVVGYGGFEATLKELIAKNNLQDCFVLLGKKTNPYPYVKSCDLYVQPSRYEGKAVTVTEAKILGKPILITNYPTAGSQLEDGLEGLICDLSVEGIAEGIENLYRNAGLRQTLIHNLKSRNYSNEHELHKLYQIL